jgi:hypothetical protein
MSGFTIPNTPDSFNQNQAEPDSLDFQILGNQRSGVVSGLVVAPGSASQTVVVSAGEVLINGAYYPYAGGTVTLTAYTSPSFFDIVHARVSGSTVTCYAVRPSAGGTNPRFPSSGTGANDVNIDSTDVVLAAVWRVDSGIPVAQAITDKRIFVRSSTARTLTDTVSANRGSAGDTYVNTAWTPNSTTASPFSVKVGTTWYNLSYWTANSNISTTGTITANGGFVGNASSASSTPYSGLTGTIPTWNQNTTGNAATANLATKASTLSQGGGNGTAMTFNWAGQSGQPTWLWGSNDGSNHYVYNPSNFSVSHASTAGTASTANAVTWANVSGKPSIGDVFNNGGTYSINVTGSAGSAGSASTAGYLSASVNVDPLGGPYIGWSSGSGWWAHSGTTQVGTLIWTGTRTTTSPANMRVIAGGEVTTVTSLRKYKEQINSFNDGLSIINSLTPRTVKAIPQESDGVVEQHEYENSIHHGFIVEEILEAQPQLIDFGIENGEITPQMWKTNDVISILVQAVKELSAKVEALEAP